MEELKIYLRDFKLSNLNSFSEKKVLLKALYSLYKNLGVSSSYSSSSNFPSDGSPVGKLYMDESDGSVYVWNGTEYKLVSSEIYLGSMEW